MTSWMGRYKTGGDFAAFLIPGFFRGVSLSKQTHANDSGSSIIFRLELSQPKVHFPGNNDSRDPEIPGNVPSNRFIESTPAFLRDCGH